MTVLRVNTMVVVALIALSWATRPDAPVADAARRGDMPAVRSLLRAGADVNAALGDGMTALHWAAQNGNTELAGILITSGARLEALTRLGAYRPLHLASKGGHGGVVKALLAAGADASVLTSTGEVSPLHFAAGSGDLESIALLDYGADVDRAERQWGHTPLMFAAAYNRAEAVVLLVERGADPALTASAIDMGKRNAEDNASKARRDQLRATVRQAAGNSVASRIAFGQASPPAGAPAAAKTTAQTAGAASPRPATGGGAPRRMSEAELIGFYGGHTALTLAARDGKVEAAMALLDGGADINQPTTGDHTTPLLMATINGHFDLAMLLLGRGADPRMAGNSGNTPLFATIHVQWAPKSRHPQTADYMQQRITHLELMEALLEAGADVNARLEYPVWYLERGNEFLEPELIGATAFLRAASGLDVDAMKLLVNYGADPNIPTLTPPGHAPGNQFLLELLRSRGWKGEDLSGLPPLNAGGPGIYPIHLAAGYGYGEGDFANVQRHMPDGFLPAVKYLVEELGADVNQRDLNEGGSPLIYAASRGDVEMIRYLVDRGADVNAVNRTTSTAADMANGPSRAISPYPEAVKLLESLGSKNNHTCVSC